jgi:hypothetical protein
MKGNSYAEITIRQLSGEKTDARKIKQKKDFFDVLEKYGDVLFKMSWEDVTEAWNIPINEVEEYVRKKRESEHRKHDSTRERLK